jgi:hypothetical protein
LAAAQQAGLRDVPVIVCTLGPIDQLTAQLTENLQRADLTPVQLSGIASGTTTRRSCRVGEEMGRRSPGRRL